MKPTSELKRQVNTGRLLTWLAIIILATANPQTGSCAGVTVITHGFQLTGGFAWPIAWVDQMADALAVRISPTDAGASVSHYVLDVTSPGTYSLIKTKGPHPATGENKADIIVKVNWTPLSHETGTADYVGSVVSAALRTPPTDGTFAKAFAELPMHFIGHSRGTYVNSAAISDMGDWGIWVDHCTILDGEDLGADGVLTNWVNIRFLDNYFQDLANGILATDHELDGFSMPGAYEISLSAYNGFFNATGIFPPRNLDSSCSRPHLVSRNN